MNVMLNLLGKAREPEAVAPAKRKLKGLTFDELQSAISMVCEDLDPDCSTYQTLERLSSGVYFGRAKDSDLVTTFDDRFPVSVAELDAVIAETQNAAPSTLSALKRTRALLAGENTVTRSEPVQHVTVQQLKAHDAALFDAFSWALGAMAAELNRGQPTREHALGMLRRTASTPERKKVLAGMCEFKETEEKPMTQAEWLRYQATGRRNP
jgi:hypothetical protein